MAAGVPRCQLMLASFERRAALAHQVVRSFVRQVLQEGYFHADPHPGNLLAVEAQPGLALLDLGAVGEVTEPMREELFRMAAAAAARDGTALAEALLAMVEEPGPPDREAYAADVSGFLDRLLAQSLRQVRFSHISEEVWGLARAHQLRIRPGYFLLLRTAVTLDGVLRELDPTLDPLAAARPHILEATVRGGAWRPAATLSSAIAQAWAGTPYGRRVVATLATVASLLIAVLAAGLAFWFSSW